MFPTFLLKRLKWKIAIFWVNLLERVLGQLGRKKALNIARLSVAYLKLIALLFISLLHFSSKI